MDLTKLIEKYKSQVSDMEAYKNALNDIRLSKTEQLTGINGYRERKETENYLNKLTQSIEVLQARINELTEVIEDLEEVVEWT